MSKRKMTKLACFYYASKIDFLDRSHRLREDLYIFLHTRTIFFFFFFFVCDFFLLLSLSDSIKHIKFLSSPIFSLLTDRPILSVLFSSIFFSFIYSNRRLCTTHSKNCVCIHCECRDFYCVGIRHRIQIPNHKHNIRKIA